MFSGIVEAISLIQHMTTRDGCVHFTIALPKNFQDLAVNDSIAVNGVCLTITKLTMEYFEVTAVPETLRLTNLGKLNAGDKVNLERSLSVNARIGGHNVQGHVDGVGQILDLQNEGDAKLAKISMPSDLAKYIVNKGYITLDGMSITVITATPEWFTVTFIPHTQQQTLVKHYDKGTWLNIEVDILSKYIEKLLEARV